MRVSRQGVLALVCMVALSVCAPCARAETTEPDAAFVQWMTYYYFYPTPKKTPDYLAWLVDRDILEKNKGAVPPYTAFLAGVFKEQTPENIRAWLSRIHPAATTKQALETALWLSGNGKLIPKLFKDVPQYLNRSPTPLLKTNITQPQHMDMMWGAFSATGDPAYVSKIIDTLDASRPLSGNAKYDAVMRAAAAWSLISNSLQHERVYRRVQQESETRPPTMRKDLKAILDAVAAKHPKLLKANGDLSALLVTTDTKTRSQFTKPSHEGLNIVQKSHMVPGEEFIVKLIFTGMALKEDYQADVTYDIALTGPDGKVENGLDKKGLRAFAERTPTRFMIFDNHAYIKMSFDDKDMAGTYTFRATLHDNVGKKDITLNRSIVLDKEKAAHP